MQDKSKNRREKIIWLINIATCNNWLRFSTIQKAAVTLCTTLVKVINLIFSRKIKIVFFFRFNNKMKLFS
jgi:hypothetical protein